MKSYDIIRRPIISESSMKPTFDREGNEIKKYTFEVSLSANKIEIKNAIEKIFGVKVSKVNTMHVLGKMKRMGKNIGRRPSYKKAIVTLAKDSKVIELLEM